MSDLENLVNWFADKNKVMIALSGWVDSAVLAYAAFQALGNSAIAVTADYKTLSEDELFSAKQLSLIHIWRCRRLLTCRSRWSPYP